MAKVSKSSGDEDTGAGKSRLRWVIGWVIIPGTLLALLFLSGMHVGARHPEMGLARALAWMFG